MENWQNLNKLLVHEGKNLARKNLESQSLVDLANSGIRKDFTEFKSILKKGASINCFADMTTPLISAIRTNNIDLGNFLLKMGATISYKPIGLSDNAFWEALKSKKHDFLELFVSNRCSLMRDTETNAPALIYATKESDVKSVEILLKHYMIKVNQRDGLGNTALHYNVSKLEQTESDTVICQLLIAAGAEINGRNLEGKTPTDLAVDYASKSVLLAAKLKETLVPKEVEPEPEKALNRTKSNKLKI